VRKVAGLVMLVFVACGRSGSDARLDGAGASDAVRDGPPATSCGGLANTCGPTGTESCCDSPVVPGGTYARSYDVSGDGMYPDSSFGATVSDFRLDKYEVTVGRFRAFVNASMGTQASPPASGAGARTLNGMANQGGWDPSFNASLTTSTTALIAAVKCKAAYQTWTDTAAANESLPMNCITWYEAIAFCAWDGGFMPTEAEWNYSASGGSEQRAYPWSSPPGFLGIDCSYANYFNFNDGFCVNPPTGATNRVGSESPKGDGKWGQSDLAGNVVEWTLDWDASPYPQNPCPDCANLTPATNRAVRGGGFPYPATAERAAVRGSVPPSARFDNIGVRCARTP